MMRQLQTFSVAGGRAIFPLLLAFLLLLPACGSKDEETDDNGVVHLTYAALGEEAVGKAQSIAKKFNLKHQDIKIDVKEYIGGNGRSDKDLLLTEILTGKIPDILDLGGVGSTAPLPYPVLVQRGYLEDLWPYIENDPELGREGVVEAPLKAAEIDGGLYTVFSHANIISLVGAESVVGSRTSWSLADMLEIYGSMPEGSTILPYSYNRDSMFKTIFSMSLEDFVDREAGTCSFDSEEFRSALEFLRIVPESFDIEAAGGSDKVMLERVDRYLHGYQMLENHWLVTPLDIQEADACMGLGGRAVHIGCPIKSGRSGNFFIPSRALAMSSACQHKEEAWAFLRELLLPQYRDAEAMERAGYCTIRINGLPVNRPDYDLYIKSAVNGTLKRMWDRGGKVFGYPPAVLHASTQEDVDRFEELVNSIDFIQLYDQTLYNIVYEATGPYFAGHKTMDETIALVENRVDLYLGENR